MRTIILLSSCFLTAALVFAQDGEQRLAPKDVPQAVKTSLSGRYPAAKITEWSKETEDGKTTYEASIIDGRAKREVTFSPEGSLVSMEEVIPVADLPEAVKTSVLNAYPKSSITKVEKVTTGSVVQYEVALKNSAKKEVLLESNGKILK